VIAGAAPAGPLPVVRVIAFLAGIAALAFCIALLWLGMRAVMDIGGFCASGGPYQIAVECPDSVVLSTPLSIMGGFLAAGLILWGGAGLGGSWAGLVLLAWPALFLSLGWNFLQYGFFAPDGGWIWSWIFCGVLFVLMGAIPLVVIGAGRGDPHEGRAYASGRVVVRPRAVSSSAGDPRIAYRPLASADPPVPPAGSATPADPGEAPLAEPIVDRLERLAAMRRRGDLTSAEYETAKNATLAEAAGDR
jgi:hypothetical protein